MSHADAHLLLAAGAVLEDLDPDESLDHAAHRAACPECQALEADLGHVLEDLALTAPLHRPPPMVLDGIRAAIRADRPPVVSLAAARASRRRLYTALALAAAFAIAAAGLGGRALSLGRELEQSRAVTASLESQVAVQGGAVAVVADPRHVTAVLQPEALAPSATAMVMYVPGTTSSYVVAQNLPATPAGHAYQLWYADAGGAHPLGTATWDGSGTFVAAVGVDLAKGEAVMITLEPEGGATGAPGPHVVFGGL